MNNADSEKFVRGKIEQSIKEDVELGGVKLDKKIIAGTARLPKLHDFNSSVKELKDYILELKARPYHAKESMVTGSTFQFISIDERKALIPDFAVELSSQT